ncbi:hypothetical protein NOJ05_18055 [Neorhizobium galegae]|uniref:hypothetical protein n=1 Tax=Neorhizobium galegae TaxID=399 RepID=UPI0021063F18|nr:hypothetical protein [Neorhizobium galegae]MCQ1779111.1 hypothetical protein [Neorhizobium galegae]MCQ1799214.1 hypothetical protein [Neorhizobium galegae]
MEVTLYAYQIVPGGDHLLFFADTLEKCQAAAIEQRADLRQGDAEDDEIGAMAVYQCTMRLPDAKIMIDALNDHESLFRACVVDRKLIALVTD